MSIKDEKLEAQVRRSLSLELESMFYSSQVEAVVRLLDAARASAEDLRYEVERLRADLDAASAELPGTDYMDQPDGGNPSLGEQIKRMLLDRDQLRIQLAAVQAERDSLEKRLNFAITDCAAHTGELFEVQGAWVKLRNRSERMLELILAMKRAGLVTNPAYEEEISAISASAQKQVRTTAPLCSDCPPEGYLTDETRCDGYPRRAR